MCTDSLLAHTIPNVLKGMFLSITAGPVRARTVTVQVGGWWSTTQCWLQVFGYRDVSGAWWRHGGQEEAPPVLFCSIASIILHQTSQPNTGHFFSAPLISQRSQLAPLQDSFPYLNVLFPQRGLWDAERAWKRGWLRTICL